MRCLKIPYNQDDVYSIFSQYLYEDSPQLSEVVRDIDWGNNKIIRGGGIRISEDHQVHGQLVTFKNWKQETSPYFTLKSGTALSTKGGRKIVIIWVGELEYYI